jgi:thiamine-phosphate pyrophosphorylase
VRLHALVEDAETARRAVADGATVVQLRLKGAATAEIVALGRELLDLEAQLVVNDDVDAALELGCGVHLGQSDLGAERAAAAGVPLGISARTRREAAVAEYSGATYIGAGPVWATPSKPDADEPIGLEGLREVCVAVTIPVVAIGGIDASNAADCIRAGASGIAVIRAVSELRKVRAAVDAAL